MCSNDKAEGFSIRGRTSEKDGSNRNCISKSRGRKSSKFCKYCWKTGHFVAECYKLKNKKAKENNQSAEVSVVDSGSDGNVLLVTTTNNRGAIEWALDSGCIYHMCPYTD